jgi:3-oxoisoapionate decarboxylase
MRIGLDAYTIGHLGLSAEATLDFAVGRGLEGVQFLEPGSIALALDHEDLSTFRRRADAMGLYLEVGLSSPNPVRQSRSEGRNVDAAEHARTLVRQVEAVAALGCRQARAYVGDRHDRFRTDVDWGTQLAATLEVLRALAPCLSANNVRIALETHADVTCDELVSLVRAVGPEAAGVTLDTGNIVMRLDEPLEAAECLAPWVLCTHIKDASLAFSPRGLRWQARPVGSGIVPVKDVIATLERANPRLNLSIELHPRTYDLPIFDPSWLAYFPSLRPSSLAALVRLAALAEKRCAEGAMERQEAIEAIPWDERCVTWLDQSSQYLRDLRDELRLEA